MKEVTVEKLNDAAKAAGENAEALAEVFANFHATDQGQDVLEGMDAEDAYTAGMIHGFVLAGGLE